MWLILQYVKLCSGIRISVFMMHKCVLRHVYYCCKLNSNNYISRWPLANDIMIDIKKDQSLTNATCICDTDKQIGYFMNDLMDVM